MRGKKLFSIVTLFITLALLLLGCQSSSPKVEKKKLRIANSHYHAAHLVPAAVAQEKGFFKEDGVEVEIIGGGLLPAKDEEEKLLSTKEYRHSHRR